MFTIIGTAAPVPIILTTTGLSLIVWTILNSLAIPVPYHTVTNIIMVLGPMASLALSIFIYAISVMRSPVIRAMYSETEDIDPSLIMTQASSRSVVATFYIECWDRNDGRKVITFTATHTHELQNVTVETPIPDVKDFNIVNLRVVPSIELTEETEEMLSSIQKSLYNHYKDRGSHCSVKYRVDVPGLPMSLTLTPGIHHNPVITTLVVCSVILTPIYLIFYRMKTKFLEYKVTKRVMPNIRDTYPSAPPM